MRLVSLTAFFLTILCKAAEYPLCYSMGYNEKSFRPLTYSDFLGLLGWVFPIVIFICWTGVWFLRKNRVFVSVMLGAVSLVIWLGWDLPLPFDRVAFGLRDRLLHDYDPDTLRHFAQEVHALPRASDDHGKGDDVKVFTREDLKASGLRHKYPFLAWLEYGRNETGPADIREDDGTVIVEWGGALSRWGFSVKVDGGKIQKPANPDYWRGYPITNDIYVVLE